MANTVDRPMDPRISLPSVLGLAAFEDGDPRTLSFLVTEQHFAHDAPFVEICTPRAMQPTKVLGNFAGVQAVLHKYIYIESR
jgi:hypothetical protein